MLHKLFKLFKKDVKVSEPEEKVLDISEPITTLLDIYKKYPKRFSCKVSPHDAWTYVYTIKYRPKNLVLRFTTRDTGFGLCFTCQSSTLTDDEMKVIYDIITPIGFIRHKRYKAIMKKRNRDRITKLLKE